MASVFMRGRINPEFAAHVRESLNLKRDFRDIEERRKHQEELEKLAIQGKQAVGLESTRGMQSRLTDAAQRAFEAPEQQARIGLTKAQAGATVEQGKFLGAQARGEELETDLASRFNPRIFRKQLEFSDLQLQHMADRLSGDEGDEELDELLGINSGTGMALEKLRRNKGYRGGS